MTVLPKNHRFRDLKLPYFKVRQLHFRSSILSFRKLTLLRSLVLHLHCMFFLHLQTLLHSSLLIFSFSYWLLIFHSFHWWRFSLPSFWLLSLLPPQCLFIVLLLLSPLPFITGSALHARLVFLILFNKFLVLLIFIFLYFSICYNLYLLLIYIMLVVRLE